MLSLGPMDKGDYLCINMDQHSGYDKFDTENLMREHWLTCHKISLTDGFAAFVLPDATKEPVPIMKLPSKQKGDRGIARTFELVPKSDRESEDELDNFILETPDDDPDA